eukprot:4052966-Amphidinium_carterae.1
MAENRTASSRSPQYTSSRHTALVSAPRKRQVAAKQESCGKVSRCAIFICKAQQAKHKNRLQSKLHKTFELKNGSIARHRLATPACANAAWMHSQLPQQRLLQ